MPKFDPVSVHGSRIEIFIPPLVDPKTIHPKEQDNSDRARQGSSERIYGSHAKNSPRSLFFLFFPEASEKKGPRPWFLVIP